MKIDVIESNFEKEVLEKSKKSPVVVDFWAAWCGPCRTLGPTLEKLSKEYKDKFILAKAETENNEKWATKFSVMSIPSVKLFKNGKVVDEFVGALPEDSVRSFLDKNL